MSIDRTQVLTSSRLAGSVKRYHTWPTFQTQTVADHTFHMLRIWLEIWGPPSPEVTTTILLHDLGEIVTGDLPFPFKSRHLEVKASIEAAEVDALDDMGYSQLRHVERRLTVTEKARIKACDLIEFYEFGLIEKTMGNQYADPIVNDFFKAIEGLRLSTLDEKYVFTYLARTRGKLTNAGDPGSERSSGARSGAEAS